MIDDLHIKNFMTFEDLEIPSLKRVNLIAGKNNSGKTALLEALRILLAHESYNSVINTILRKRGAFIQNSVRAYSPLFNRKKEQAVDFIQINKTKIFKPQKNELDTGALAARYSIRHTHHSRKSLKNSELYENNSNPPWENNITYVPYNSFEIEALNRLWEPIVLTPKEDDVIQILQEAIEPKLIRFDVGTNYVKIRLNDSQIPVPIQTLGDGVKRILLIALSLANAQGKYLLIDEIELGLHYSVMEKLWEIIFKYAKEWDIQVFITTHSQDAIRTFQYVCSQEKYKDDAQFIRLQIGRKGNNEAIIYDGKRLSEALDLAIEIR